MESTTTVDKLPEAFYDSRMLSTDQAMEMLGMCRATLFKFMMNKQDPLPSYKIGRKRKLKLDEVLWWIKKHEV